MGFPGGSVIKNLLANAEDTGSIPGSGRSPGDENDNPLQNLCLENPMDRRTWQAAVHGVAKESDMTEQLSIHVCVYICIYIHIYVYTHIHTYMYIHTHVCVCVYEYNTYKIKSGSQMREVGRMRRMTLLWFPPPTPNHMKSLSILTVSLGFG